MLLEILEVLKYAISQVSLSTLTSIQTILSTMVYVAQIIRANWAVSSILERILVMVFALGIVYAAYKFLWDSAKLIVVFFAAMFLILFAEGFLF